MGRGFASSGQRELKKIHQFRAKGKIKHLENGGPSSDSCYYLVVCNKHKDLNKILPLSVAPVIKLIN